MKKFNYKKNMKGIIASVVIVGTIFAILCVNTFYFRTATLDDFSMRGVWLSYQDLYEMDQTSKASFTKEVKNVKETLERNHLNTLYLQVRPFSDAIYDSKLFPKSSYVKDCNFDVLQLFIDEFKDSDIDIIGWINPYRISLTEQTYNHFKENSQYKDWLDDDHVINYDTNKAILNPANKESQNYILKGIEEVVSNYDIKGIVFDDYFYVPGTHGKTSKQDRFDHVNALVKKVYQLSHKYNKTFGISSQANYDNCQSEGADVDSWLQTEGYIDYLMPQIYWSNEYLEDGTPVEMFNQRCEQFSRIKRNKNVELYASLGLYKCGLENEVDLGWAKSSDNLSNQVQKLFRKYTGYTFYSYRHLNASTSIAELDKLYQDHYVVK